jgi:hypothetical protein
LSPRYAIKGVVRAEQLFERPRTDEVWIPGRFDNEHPLVRQPDEPRIPQIRELRGVGSTAQPEDSADDHDDDGEHGKGEHGALHECITLRVRHTRALIKRNSAST